MGRRADALEILLADLTEVGAKTPRPGEESIARAGLVDEVQWVYEQLGGVQPDPRLQPGPWDFTFDRLVLELDEENHFNRYRRTTLGSPSYELLKAFDRPAYRKYCEAFESKCSTHGGYWVNGSAQREFGEPGERGDLEGAGSPRWKQRAFYDYLKDLAPLTDGVAVSRIAIWDSVSADGESVEVGTILKLASVEDLTATGWPEALLALVEARTVRPG